MECTCGMTGTGKHIRSCPIYKDLKPVANIQFDRDRTLLFWSLEIGFKCHEKNMNLEATREYFAKVLSEAEYKERS